ncbi:MAG: hypothetical protein LBD16_01740 [Oscillospiraceae bacterium]|jgi:hypothetical protein|nr:hypothetical protein [Oscillospiraceae bacterium]
MAEIQNEPIPETTDSSRIVGGDLQSIALTETPAPSSVVSPGISNIAAIATLAIVALLFIAITLLNKLKDGAAKKPAPPAAPIVTEVKRVHTAAPPPVPSSANADDEIAAVISAAVAYYLAEEQPTPAQPPASHAVKSAAKLPRQKAWQRVGREEQVYSRL